jgi:hypothetical protein
LFQSGFCGIRTLPFEKPLVVKSNDGGIYIKCRFTSDEEPERRVWKVTTRTDSSRGEQLYQALIEIPTTSSPPPSPVSADTATEQQTQSQQQPQPQPWVTVLVPFDKFRLVSGARLMSLDAGNGMNTTGGLYQIGMVMSKFTIAAKMTAIDNFRPGYFELQLQEMGLFTTTTTTKATTTIETTPTTTEEESAVITKPKTTPLILQLLQPLARLFFTEDRYVYVVVPASSFFPMDGGGGCVVCGQANSRTNRKTIHIAIPLSLPPHKKANDVNPPCDS